MNNFSHTIVTTAIILGFVILLFIGYKVFIINKTVGYLNNTVSSWDQYLIDKNND